MRGTWRRYGWNALRPSRASRTLELKGSQIAIEGLPQGLMQPFLVLPLTAYREISAVVFYGGHARAEAIDPDERRISLIANAEALRVENAALRKQGKVLR